VLAQNHDRFAREPAYLSYLREAFGQHGCKLRALNDRRDDSPEGQLTDGILDQIAYFERFKIAEGSRRSKLPKAREGKIVALHTPGTGSSSMPPEMPTRLTRQRWRSSATSSVWSGLRAGRRAPWRRFWESRACLRAKGPSARTVRPSGSASSMMSRSPLLRGDEDCALRSGGTLESRQVLRVVVVIAAPSATGTAQMLAPARIARELPRSRLQYGI